MISGTKERLERDFTYHPPTPVTHTFYEEFRSMAKDLALWIDGHCPDSREKSLAITKLEECVFWGNASIARNGGPKV